MKKKIIIGCIIAVVIFIGLSFTSVVGFRSVESSVKDSPLFNTRTNRAIGKESIVLNCNYVKNHKTLPFPNRDEKSAMVQKVVVNIRKMDDKTFETFITSVINLVGRDNRFNSVKPERIKEALHLFRDSDKPIPIFNDETENFRHTIDCQCNTCRICITFGEGIKGFLGCIIAVPLLTIWLIIINIIRLFGY